MYWVSGRTGLDTYSIKYELNTQKVLCFHHTISDIDDCSTVKPCMNAGSCTDGINDYTCDCVLGYTGVNCETGTVFVTSVFS